LSDDLSAEDRFRLEVLIAQDLRAVCIDETAMVLRALTGQGEASIPLVPNCRPDKYLRLIRELLSGHALGSPGGYPVYLSRWTRHGQMEGLHLGKLLLTGEPEAVAAVAYSPALTDELAGHVWWIAPTIENARLMLRREAVARGRMGRVLAAFLVEHLPFLQDDHLAIMDTVAVLLFSRALDPEQIAGVWRRGRRCNTYYVAFLEMAALETALPLPEPLPPHPDHATVAATLATQLAGGDPRAQALARMLSAQGQTFLAAAAEVLTRPETQEVVARTLNAIGRYVAGNAVWDDAAGIHAADTCLSLAPRLEAVTRLARAGEETLKPIFARTTSIGSLMRHKIEPVVTPLMDDIRYLQG